MSKHDRSLRQVPVWVWVLTAVGAVVGVLLAAPGDVVGNTIPSALTFAAAALIVGVVAWRIQVATARRRPS